MPGTCGAWAGAGGATPERPTEESGARTLTLVSARPLTQAPESLSSSNFSFCETEIIISTEDDFKTTKVS